MSPCCRGSDNRPREHHLWRAAYSSPAVAADVVWALPAQHVIFVVRPRNRGDLGRVRDVHELTAFLCENAMRVSFAFTQPLAITKITKLGGHRIWSNARSADR